MSGTQLRLALASHADAMSEQIESGPPEDLTVDEKAALWLVAFSLPEPLQQQVDVRADLYSIG
jgi:hypothetical protein